MQDTQLNDLRLLSQTEAAAYLGLKPATLQHWRTTGRYNLPYVKAGRYVRYRLDDLLAFIERRTATHTGERQK